MNSVDALDCDEAQNRPSIHVKKFFIGGGGLKSPVRSEVAQNVTAVTSKDRTKESSGPRSTQKCRVEEHN